MATTVVAATVGALAAEPGHVSGVMLILLAAVFPAVFAAGLVGNDGFWKAFCAGAIIPAAIVFQLTMTSLFSVVYPGIYPRSAGLPYLGAAVEVQSALERAATDPGLRSNLALYWVAMLTVGLMSAAFHGLARANSPQNDERKTSRASFARLAMFWLVIAAAAVGSLAAERNRYSGFLMISLVCVFSAALAAGIVGSRGVAKAFCAGAYVPAGIALYMTIAHFYTLDSLEEMPRFFDAVEEVTMSTYLRHFVVLFWALSAIMGFASAGIYQVFSRSSLRDG